MFADGHDFANGFHIVDSHRQQVDQWWTQPWGEARQIHDHHNELRIDLATHDQPARRFSVIFRVFDDGLGFRYHLPEQAAMDDYRLLDELSEFHFEQNLRAWWIPAYRPNRYEYHYSASPLDALDVVHTPVTLEGDNIAVSIHEAALVDYASMALRKPGDHGQTLKADLVPWADGTLVYGELPLTTPWRTIQIAARPHELANSRLILNLNEPNALGDVSWVKPAKYVGIWWCMHIRECTWATGEQHGATTEHTLHYLDFAAEHGFDGVLVEGWNIGWDGNWIENGHLFRFTEPVAAFDMKRIAAHARKIGVPLIGHHETGANIINYEQQLDAAFAYAAENGIRAVKTGYVGNRLDGKEWHHGQYMVRHFNRVIRTAARHKIALDAHEPIKDTGLRRTYPNMMTREGARGGEYDAWSNASQGNHPEHAAVLPYTRMLSGPMDYTPGVVNLRFGDNQGMSSTIARQLALMVVLYSPLQMAADLPRNYVDHPAFSFIKAVPVDWEHSIALDGAIGRYFVIARQDRNSDDWYLAAVTNETARTLEVPLDFLDADSRYHAQIYQDGEGAHWNSAPHSLAIREQAVQSSDILSLPMAPGGGIAIRLTPANTDSTQQ
ncbi:MAG: glycoside hydrolase family 97 protein [Wenzhouxiangellaceae bacterium]